MEVTLAVRTHYHQLQFVLKVVNICTDICIVSCADRIRLILWTILCLHRLVQEDVTSSTTRSFFTL